MSLSILKQALKKPGKAGDRIYVPELGGTRRRSSVRDYVKNPDRYRQIVAKHKASIKDKPKATTTTPAKKTNPYMGRKSFRGADEAAQKAKEKALTKAKSTAVKSTKAKSSHSLKAQGESAKATDNLMRDLGAHIKKLEEQQYIENVTRMAQNFIKRGPTNSKVKGDMFTNRSPLYTALNFKPTGARVKVTYYSSRLRKETTGWYDELTPTFNEAQMRKAAKEYAEAVSREAMAKINQKVPGIVATSATVFFPSYKIIGKIGDDAVEITQQSIINRSVKDKLFNQYPARIKMNGKAISEEALLKHLRGKGAKVAPVKLKGKPINENNPNGGRFSQGGSRGNMNVTVYDENNEVVFRKFFSTTGDRGRYVIELQAASKPGVKAADAAKVAEGAVQQAERLRNANFTNRRMMQGGSAPKPIPGSTNGMSYRAVTNRNTGEKSLYIVSSNGRVVSVQTYKDAAEREAILARF